MLRTPLLIVTLLFGVVAFAQPQPPAPPSPVPLDGGLGLLALAGGAYAAGRPRKKR